MVRRKAKILTLSLRKKERLSSFYSDYLRLKRILIFFGGSLKKRQFYNLLNLVSTKNRLVGLFTVIYFRLDFFLVMVNLALSGNQARQFIKHGHVFVNKVVVKDFNFRLKEQDLVSLSDLTQRQHKYQFMKTFISSFGIKKFNRSVPFIHRNFLFNCVKSKCSSSGSLKDIDWVQPFKRLHRRRRVYRLMRTNTMYLQALDRALFFFSLINFKIWKLIR